jgi:hypothetical protein
MKQLRTLVSFASLAARMSRLPDDGKGTAIGYREGDDAGGLAMLSHVASERAIPQLECDRQPIAITLTDRRAGIGRVLGNSYDMGHGSYPR